jgi:hypothetical protein
MYLISHVQCLFTLLGVTLIISCSQSDDPDQLYFDLAFQNGELVNEGYNRCLSFTYDWLKEADPVSGLIPENLKGGRDIWNGHNPAADNYPFMVLTSYLLDPDLFNGTMMEILQTERELTSRLGSMPAAYSFSRRDFVNDQIDTARIIFSTSEYMKDGLVPLLEYMGNSPWSKRMMEMLDDLNRYVDVVERTRDDTQSAAPDNEVNGELLQVLSRVYWMTKERQYLDWAISIGDYYLLENPAILMEAEVLRLRDHGCEILGGLSEIYATLHFEDQKRKNAYQMALYDVMDRVLDIGRNEHGMFFNEVNMKTGAIKVLGFLGAHDSGRMMNELTYRNQVFGGIAMGIGLGKTERRILDGVQTGKMLNKNCLDYAIPTVLDVATGFHCVPIDPEDQEANTVGCKGIGEPATIPTASAFANAVYNATGVRITNAPINRVNFLNAIAASEQGD